MGRSDEELMLSYRGGDEAAFEMLYRRHEKPLLNFFYRVVMNAVEAENLCQETFFRIVRARKKYEATAKFKTWLFQIALNLCRDRLRRMKHRSHISLNTKISGGFYYEARRLRLYFRASRSASLYSLLLRRLDNSG